MPWNQYWFSICIVVFTMLTLSLTHTHLYLAELGKHKWSMQSIGMRMWKSLSMKILSRSFTSLGLRILSVCLLYRIVQKKETKGREKHSRKQQLLFFFWQENWTMIWISVYICFLVAFQNQHTSTQQNEELPVNIDFGRDCNGIPSANYVRFNNNGGRRTTACLTGYSCWSPTKHGCRGLARGRSWSINP